MLKEGYIERGRCSDRVTLVLPGTEAPSHRQLGPRLHLTQSYDQANTPPDWSRRHNGDLKALILLPSSTYHSLCFPPYKHSLPMAYLHTSHPVPHHTHRPP